MKKWILIELITLVLLIIAAAVVFLNLVQPADVPEAETRPVVEIEETTEPVVPEETEPEPTWMLLDEDYSLIGKQYFVYDCETGVFTMISGSSNERVYPASITKLFTGYVATQFLDPDTRITVGDELNMVVWGSSVADLKKGDTLTVEQLVEGMLLPSGNDAAYVLAAAAGREICGQPNADAMYAVTVFMDEMNRQAGEVGMTDSHFVNPDGIHSDEHYMSMADLALLGQLSIDNETVLKCAKINRKIVDLQDGAYVWKNTNELTNPLSKYYCPYAVGLKTGQTPSAGSCLLSGFVTPERKLVIGVFQCEKTEDRFADTLYLLNQELGLQ